MNTEQIKTETPRNGTIQAHKAPCNSAPGGNSSQEQFDSALAEAKRQRAQELMDERVAQKRSPRASCKGKSQRINTGKPARPFPTDSEHSLLARYRFILVSMQMPAMMCFAESAEVILENIEKQYEELTGTKLVRPNLERPAPPSSQERKEALEEEMEILKVLENNLQNRLDAMCSLEETIESAGVTNLWTEQQKQIVQEGIENISGELIENQKKQEAIECQLEVFTI